MQLSKTDPATPFSLPSVGIKILFVILLASLLSFSCFAQPFAYVASVSSSTMTVINIANNTVVGNSLVIDGGLTGVAASPNGSTIYLTAQSSNQVQIVSTASNNVVGSIGVGASPVAVAFSPNGALAYVVNQGSSTVSVINTAASSVIANIPVESRPSGVAVNSAGTRAVVTNTWGSDLSVIDTASNKVIANIPVGGGLSGVAITPSGNYAYATNQTTNSVSIVSLTSNSLLGTIPVQNYPNSVAISPNGSRAFVTNGNSSSVSVIDLASNTVIATLGVGDNPTAIAITQDGSRAEVTNANSYSTSVIDANALSVIGSINRIGIYPTGVAIAPAAAASTGGGGGGSGGGGGGGNAIPCAYSLSSATLGFVYTGGAGAVGLNVAAGATNCNWTATSNAAWISIVSGSAGSGIGTTGFNVAVNPSPTPRAGTITIAGLTFTITQNQAPLTTQPPTADSIAPSSGSGSSQVFQAVFSDPLGYTDITYAQVLINSSLDGSNTCWVSYNRANNQIFLLNDAGTAYLGPVTPGIAGTVAGSQCAVDARTSSVSGSGNTLTLSLAFTFNAPYAGTKSSYLLAINGSGLSSGWQNRGTWVVPAGGSSMAPPTADWISPASDTGAGRVFSVSYSDVGGPSFIAWTELLFGPALQAPNSCWIAYNHIFNTLWVYNDNMGFNGPITPGTAGTIQNGQCIVDGAGSSISTSGNSLVVNVNVIFKPGFAGPKNAYAVSMNGPGLNGGWQMLGTYNVHF